MKKTVWVCVLSALVLLCVGGTALYVSRTAGEELEALCRSAMDAAQTGDWDACLSLIRGLDRRWAELEPVLELWTVHEDTDQVSVSIRRMLVSARAGDVLMLRITGEELLHACRHLHHRDAPGPGNIL